MNEIEAFEDEDYRKSLVDAKEPNSVQLNCLLVLSKDNQNW